VSAVYLTIDIDWVADVAIDHCLKLLREAGAQAQFFLTHATPALERIRAEGHALGLHPNLLPHLRGASESGAEETLARLHELAPEAKAVRSHGLVRGSWLSQLFLRRGFTHEANLYVPWRSGASCAPFEHPPGLVQVAHDWGDYSHVSSGGATALDDYLARPGPHVLTFHPIHLFLNSTTLAHYDQAKVHTKDGDRLAAERAPRGAGGVEDFFHELVAAVGARGGRFESLLELKPSAEGP